jgi:biopolymer transport protein ExbD
MASIDVGDKNKRDVNRALPLIPFIDFLLCLISFLLITAVWSQLARVEANAQIGPPKFVGPTDTARKLHVRIHERKFDLEWRQGSTLIATSSVVREPVPAGDGDITYPELARKLVQEWQNNGQHRNETDRKQDLAVLHTSNTTAFGELVAVMDAIQAPHREIDIGGTPQRVAAFSVSFAVD